MGAAFGAVLGLAVGGAISPVPIIAVILMLFSKAAKLNSLSFLAGWIIGLLGAGTMTAGSAGVTAGPEVHVHEVGTSSQAPDHDLDRVDLPGACLFQGGIYRLFLDLIDKHQ